MRVHIAVLSMIGMAVGIIAFKTAEAVPPATAKRPVVDAYHGVEVSDDYRWLEDDKAAEVREWINAQNAHTRSLLDLLPDTAAIRARVTEIMMARPASYSQVNYRKGRYFAMKNQPPKQQPLLVVLDSVDNLTSERAVVDPNVLDSAGLTAIDWYTPSDDGKLVAVSMSKSGTEAGDTHIYEADTGKEVFEVVPHTNSGTAGGDLAWTPDGKGFYYTRHPWPGERPDADLGFYQNVYFHKLGTKAEDDRYELGKDLPKISEIQLEVDDRTGRVLVTVQNGDGGQFAHFLREADGTWQQFTKFTEKTVQAVFGPHDDLFLVSRQGAPRGMIQHIAIAGLGKTAPETIIPEEKDAIVPNFMDPKTFVVTANRLYLVYQLGGPSEIRAFDQQGKKLAAPAQLALANIVQLEPLSGDDLMFGALSYLQPPAMYAFSAADGSTKKTALASQSPVSFDDAEVVREFATSKDGTKVPVNIIRLKGTKLDGKNPCIATGYGGYGVNNSPRFQPTRRMLLDQGFVIAVANIRGGGEYGEAWHLAGNLTKKQNVFDDFVGVLRHLIERKYTSPNKLAIMGGSNGGLLMGATFTQNPDLVKCVVSFVGIYDSLRSELSPNGEFNITEFGTVKDRDQFKALYAYSPYHHVKDGAKYPAVLMFTGMNDPRVEPMQSRKMAARLQTANASDAPILLRTSDASGHGGDTPLKEQIDEAVDQFSFIFDQLGIKFRAPADTASTTQ